MKFQVWSTVRNLLGRPWDWNQHPFSKTATYSQIPVIVSVILNLLLFFMSEILTCAVILNVDCEMSNNGNRLEFARWNHCRTIYAKCQFLKRHFCSVGIITLKLAQEKKEKIVNSAISLGPADKPYLRIGLRFTSRRKTYVSDDRAFSV